MCAVLLFPLYWMVVVALSTRAELLGGTLRLWPRELTLDNVERVFASFPVLTWFGNSVAISLTVSLLTVTVNLMAGYAFAHLRFRGSNVLFLLVLVHLMLPVQVIMVRAVRLVTGLGLYGSYWAVILPTAASAFGIFLARQFILAIPRELIEAARLDGAGQLVGLPRIVLPLSKPLIAVLFFMSLLPVLERLRLAADRAEAERAVHPADRAALPAGPVRLRLRRHDGVRAAQRGPDGGDLPGLPALLRPGFRAQRHPLSSGEQGTR